MSLPKLAVHKFASCDGCQLSLLCLEDELLDIAGVIQIANFPEASSEIIDGPYAVSLIEGSITSEHDRLRLAKIREESEVVISIGACATAGGIQALKNVEDVKELTKIVYAHPEYISTLDNSTPIADHIKVDYELQGCPVNKYQLLEVIVALLQDRKPNIAAYSVCVECKRRNTTCVAVTKGEPCLGPITKAGCDALCPTYHRGCFGCYGLMEDPNEAALKKHLQKEGMDDRDLYRFTHKYCTASPNTEED